MNTLPLTHRQVQRLRRLLGRRSFRVEEQVLVVEGAKVLAEALDAAASVEGVYVAPGGVDDPVVARAASLGIAVHALAPGVVEKIGDTVTPQPVLAVVASPLVDLPAVRVALLSGGFAIVAVTLQDPGNAGTIIRSAEAAGAAAVILCDASVDATNPKVVRSSAGALFHVPVVQTSDSGASVARALREWGVRCWATSSVLAGGVPYDELDLTGPTAILLGNEANGLAAEVVDGCDGLITIPMAGKTESLNVGMAGAVLAFEAARQRRAR